MIKDLSEQTVERLSQYRHILQNYQYLQHAYIFSHSLARIIKATPATVRRDLMLIGVNGSVHKGYDIGELLAKINEALDGDEPDKVCFVGIGQLGKAVSEQLHERETKLKITASFYFDPSQATETDIPCYHIGQLSEIIKKENILICALAVPKEFAKDISLVLVNAGIIGILNFTSAQLQLPPHVFVENYDLLSKLEKIAYFMKRLR